MPLVFRLALALLAMAAVLVVLNIFVFRRAAAAFHFSPRTRRIAAATLALPLLVTAVFRTFGTRLPVGFAEPLVVTASAFEMGIVLASVVLGGAALVGRLRRVVAALRRLRGAPAPEPGMESASATTSEGAAREVAASDVPARETATSEVAAREVAASDAPARETTTREVAARQVAARASAAGESVTQALRSPHTAFVSRRLFVEQAVAGSALAVGATSAGYGALFGRHDYELSTVPVPIPGLAKQADGFTIVQLSDIHLGQFVGEAEMRAAEELVRKAKGDLVVLTGDLVDHDPRYNERLGRLVRRLSGIRPVVAIPGNHDYYTGVDTVLATLREAGATVLVNQATTLLGERGGFVLAGLDDQWGEPRGGGPNLARALADVRSDAPRIVLCHNPKYFLEAAGEVALQLSGHTHGGQLNFGLRPAELVLRHGYIAGLYENKGSRLYVNRGFGTAGPAMRVGAPPEVSRIVLVSA